MNYPNPTAALPGLRLSKQAAEQMRDIAVKEAEASSQVAEQASDAEQNGGLSQEDYRAMIRAQKAKARESERELDAALKELEDIVIDPSARDRAERIMQKRATQAKKASAQVKELEKALEIAKQESLTASEGYMQAESDYMELCKRMDEAPRAARTKLRAAWNRSESAWQAVSTAWRKKYRDRSLKNQVKRALGL